MFLAVAVGSQRCHLPWGADTLDGLTKTILEARCTRLGSTSYGGAEQLQWMRVPDPRPGPGEVLVTVLAAGVNFIDTYQRTGLYPIDPPFTLGMEGAGVVRELGEGVDGLAGG